MKGNTVPALLTRVRAKALAPRVSFGWKGPVPQWATAAPVPKAGVGRKAAAGPKAGMEPMAAMADSKGN